MLKNNRKSSILANKLRNRAKVCPFCKSKTLPRWEDHEILKDFLSPRSRIISAQFSGVCVKHQRVLSKAVKQARHLGLLPFVTK